MKLPRRFIRAMRHVVPAAVLLLASLEAIPAAGQMPSMFDPTVTQIAAGASHTCALTTAGTVQCWGLNGNGQVGNGFTINATAPVVVSGLQASSIAAIAAGGYHTCALTTSGFVKCWGRNGNGELGDFTTTDRTTPVASGGLVGVAAITAGSYHTCALTTAGAVMCWGLNADGELGDGTHTSKTTAVPVSGLSSGIIAIAAGGFHTCALNTAGVVKCWGYNSSGQLGDGTTTGRIAPITVNGLTGVAAISAGNGHTCALTSAGTVKCWGSNASGQLGNGSTTNSLTPVAVSGLSNVAAIAAGSGHTCALTTAGALKCWGANGSGQIGNGNTTDATTPAAVTGMASDVAAVTAGGSHACALDATGGLKCWGYDTYGQLGDSISGSTANKLTPVPVKFLTTGITTITGGFLHTCAVNKANMPLCWGYNNYGQLGDGGTTIVTTPDRVGLPEGATAIAAGTYHTCALTTLGAVKCWGDNEFGQLGGPVDPSFPLVPVAVTGLDSGVAAIAAGYGHACALTTAGAVKCWGDNEFGQLGNGGTTNASTPVAVNGLDSGVAAIAAGYGHTCALTTAGAVKCWGYNLYGQLGNGSDEGATFTPAMVNGLSSGVAAIATGGYHTCALTTAGAIKCWGWNISGQLGDGTQLNRLTPVAVSGLTSGVAAVTAGTSHTCALTASGAVKCWGYNNVGQLGDGTKIEKHTPTTVSGLTGASAIAAGGFHTCSLTTRGTVECWGQSSTGQLGIADPTDQLVPITLLAGQSVAFVPSARMGAGNSVSLFASGSAGAVYFDTWTPDTCSASGNLLTLHQSGLCGVRASQAGGSDGNGGTLAAAPQQLRLIQVEADLIFANGLDVWNGLNH